MRRLPAFERNYFLWKKGKLCSRAAADNDDDVIVKNSKKVSKNELGQHVEQVYLQVPWG